jgi:hypothetical protein
LRVVGRHGRLGARFGWLLEQPGEAVLLVGGAGWWDEAGRRLVTGRVQFVRQEGTWFHDGSLRNVGRHSMVARPAAQALTKIN